MRNAANLAGQVVGGAGVGLSGAVEMGKAYDDSKTLNDAAPDNTTALQDTAALAGERTGRFAGGIAGAGLGASAGSALGPIGTAVGGVAGGALGYFAPDLLKKGTDALGITDASTLLPSDKAAGLRAASPPPITAPQPAATTNAGPATPNSFPTTPDLGLGAGSPSASPAPSINDQSALPQGVTKTIGANGVPQYGNVGPGSPAAPGGGVDLAGANAIEARANAIRASTLNTSDPNALFQNTNGVASTIGSTPYGGNIVPRQTVTPGGGIGGLITQKFANRGRALDIEQQHVIGDQALHGQDLGLRRQQLGFDNQFRAASLNHTIDHDAGTLGLGHDQLAREADRDKQLAGFHKDEIGVQTRRADIESKRFDADYGLRQKADVRAETSENQRIRDDGTDKYNKLVSQQLPVGPDGKPDQGAANFHTAAANQAVGDRIAALQAHLKTNQGDTAAQGDLQALQTKGLGALDDGERSKLFAGSEFARLANDTGTGSLNPFGSTNVQSRAPATSLTKIPRLSGDVYRDQLGREVPARYIENVGGARFNATRNRQFDPLLRGGQ